MLDKLILLVHLTTICLGASTTQEKSLSSILEPSPIVKADPPPLFAALAAVSPLGPFQVEQLQTPNTGQMAQLTAAGGLTDLLSALGSVKPPAESTIQVGSLLGSLFPSRGTVQPAPVPVQPQRINMFNPLSFLFPGIGGGGGSSFNMIMPGMMMRMMENVLELF